MDARTNEPLLESDSDSDVNHALRSGKRPSIGVIDVVETLRRNWRLPWYGFLIGLVLGATYLITAPNPYKSSARVLVDRSMSRYLQNNKIVDQPTFDESEIGSQQYVVTSDSVILPVVRSLDLTHDSDFVGRPRMGGARLFDIFGDLKRGIAKLVGLRVAPAENPEAVLERAAIDSISKRLTATREDIANVINVSFESQDRNKAAEIANAIADSYVKTTMDAKLNSTKVASQWLQDRLVELKKQVEKADLALQDFKVANKLNTNSAGPEQRANLETQLANAQIATAEAKSRLDRIRQKTGEDITTTMGTDALNNHAKGGVTSPGELFSLTNNELTRLRAQYRNLMTRANDIESHVGPNHPITQKYRRQANDVQAAIRAEEQRIADSYANEYQVAKARETEIAATLANMSSGTQLGSELRELESSAEALHKVYDGTLQKFKEINTVGTEAIPVQSARVITRAVPALSKKSRKGWAVLAGGMMLGLLLGAGTAVGREWVADVFRTPKAVEQVTGYKCVVLPRASIPDSIEDLVLDEPYSRFTEALRKTKTEIDSNRAVHGSKVIGVVSALPNEGKTTVAANLAALMTSASGARILVIDSDFHVRKLSAALAPNARQGLLEALENPTRLSWLSSQRQRSGLNVLPCVAPSRIPNSAELLGSEMMAQLLAVARKSYDHIIIEIAPIMSVVDMKLIERFVDQFVFVIEWGATKRTPVLDALSEAEAIRDRIACVILNKADPVAIQHIESYKGITSQVYYQS
ncbi:MAG: AAA family ATPase [Xanthobacteraceae bacterium]|nr:AAA family ATPase [Xanthobacteraceae bacterium]